MPLKIGKNAKGETTLAITSFSADEIRQLSADAEPAAYTEVQQLRDQLHELRRDAGMEIDGLRQELAAERRQCVAYRQRLANCKAAPADWLWWPILAFALIGIIEAAKFVGALMGWL